MLAAVPDISGWFLKKKQVLRGLRSKIEGRIANP
ncbi:ABC transporter ATP-binding protein [Klebsiella aerogenes]|nr:ABC transporter ATP-binding protein [Klebsiella aerogenes]